MSTMIQIRNVPSELHKRLKMRALMSNKTLSDYLLDQINQFAFLPTAEELLERLKHRSSSTLFPTKVLRRERDSR
jgi:hypothetical protein